MKILLVGDIFGQPGRRIVKEMLPKLAEEYAPDLVLANAENAAGGFGITPPLVEGLLDMGIAVLTSGNHIWDKKETGALLDTEPRLLRPANYPAGNPGRGWCTANSKRGIPVGVVNLHGVTFMTPIESPFLAADRILRELSELATPVLGALHTRWPSSL